MPKTSVPTAHPRAQLRARISKESVRAIHAVALGVVFRRAGAREVAVLAAAVAGVRGDGGSDVCRTVADASTGIRATGCAGRRRPPSFASAATWACLRVHKQDGE